LELSLVRLYGKNSEYDSPRSITKVYTKYHKDKYIKNKGKTNVVIVFVSVVSSCSKKSSRSNKKLNAKSYTPIAIRGMNKDVFRCVLCVVLGATLWLKDSSFFKPILAFQFRMVFQPPRRHKNTWECRLRDGSLHYH
jgi:hypothetical protein